MGGTLCVWFSVDYGLLILDFKVMILRHPNLLIEKLKVRPVRTPSGIRVKQCAITKTTPDP